MLKAVYDSNVPTKNLITTISGVITLLISLLVMFGVLTPEQAEGVTTHTNTLMTLIPGVVLAVTGLIAIFKAKDA